MVERFDDNENILQDSKSQYGVSDVDVEYCGFPSSPTAAADNTAAASVAAPTRAHKSSRRKSSRRKTTSLSATQHQGSTRSPSVVSSPSSIHLSASHVENGAGGGETKSERGLPRNNSEKSLRTAASRKDDGISEIQEEKRSWFEGMYPSYKSRNKEYKEYFSDQDFKFIVDFSCAHHKDILRQGRMYISTGYVCFYSKIFSYEHTLKIAFQDIAFISKEKTAYLIPNAIQIATKNKKTYFFTTFHNRDSTYDIMSKLWTAVDSGDSLSEDELCQMIMIQYPEEDVPDGVMTRSSSHQPVTFTLGASNSTLNLAAPNHHQNQHSSGQGRESLQDIIKDWLDTVPGEIILNSVIQKPVAEIQSLLFTNSNFYFTFQKNRGTTELDVGDWECGEGEKGRTREVSYNMKINNPVGPKTCQVKEIQIERTCCSPGQIYCIDLEAFNSGVPYSDSFTVRTHICVHKETESTCRILVKAEIVFKKELWGYIKGKIETNAWNGIKSFYVDLGSALSQHREDVHQVADHYAAREKQVVNGVKKGFSEPVLKGPDNIDFSWSGILFSLVILMLCVTCVVNLVILTNMHLLQPSRDKSLTNGLSGGGGLPSADFDPLADIDLNLLEILPQTDKEWFQLFRAQVAQHHQVRQEISDSLKRISDTLVEAEQILEHAGDILKRTSDENSGSLESLLRKLANTKQTMEL